MLDPRKLKAGWQIQLQQDNKGQWKEYLLNKEGQIVAVEDIKLFEKSKLEASTPNNYEELKKNYQYLSKKEELTPPIEIIKPWQLSDTMEPLDNNEIDPPEDDNIDGGCGMDDPEIEEEPEEVNDKEPDPEADRDLEKEQEEKTTDRECETKQENRDSEEKEKLE